MVIREFVKIMIGAIIGDICGSIYEFENFKTDNPDEIEIPAPKSFFTDDSVLTCAVMDSLLTGKSYKKALIHWAKKNHVNFCISWRLKYAL